MRLFEVYDELSEDGPTGLVARGVQWDDDTCAMRWETSGWIPGGHVSVGSLGTILRDSAAHVVYVGGA